MDVIESIKKDKAYIKCKLVVKAWENEFKTKHSRTPSRFDIKEAPAKIKYAYKKYFQLKSSALESSFSVGDILDETFESSQQEFDIGVPDPVSSPISQDPPLPELPSSQQLENLLQEKVQSKITLTQPLAFSENLSKKLFRNKTFSIRNPRKSLLGKPSPQKLDSNNLENSNNLLNLSQPNNFSEHLSSSSDLTVQQSQHNITPEIKFGNGTAPIEVHMMHPRKINPGWLDRVAGIEELQNQKIESKTTMSSTPSFGLTNIKINVLNNSDQHDPETSDFIENSDSEGEDKALIKLKPALKKMKFSPSKEIVQVNSRHDEIKSIKKSGRTKSQPKRQVKSKGNKKSNKLNDDLKNNDNVSVQPPDITEYVPFALEDNITPRHRNVDSILQTIDSTACVKNIEPSISSDSKTEKLELKIKSGTLNENFVKINIEKKVYVRGKKNTKYSTYKKKLWKDKKALHAGMEHPEAGKMTCFKCGQSGHMARYCTAHKGDHLLPLESYDENELPTLEDMQNLVSQESKSTNLTEELSQTAFQSTQVPDSFLKLLSDSPNDFSAHLKPIYPTYQQETPAELKQALSLFGHTEFRSGQEQAIKRILSGMSTLLILSTGGGKSLCYQLPAYIYSKHFKCITLVISPLVSLMEDQVLNMPEFLKAGCLHTNQPPTQRRKIIQCLKDGEINILLISPEALISGDGSNSFSGLFKSLPPIAFACIDEVHCVSQWSHNFRPSYLMICRVLREKLNVNCILGLTATASKTSIKSIISHINIPDGLTGVITNPTLPDNLFLSASFEKDKDRALVSYLTTEKISSFNSIIVYCIRRDECVRVAGILRSCLQETGKINMEKENKKRKRMSYIAEAYHAGMSGAQRKKIQKHFMDGTLRIIVATVAFGMGINKADIRCIIHYNMPSSFESYVQEVGRAGRDGKPAFCHVFMSSGNSDKNELLKHIYTNSIDRPIIRKLLQQVFIPCDCRKNDKEKTDPNSKHARCKGHEVGIPIDSTVEQLDLPSENLATLLCYIELHPKQYVKVMNNAYIMCKISSYGGPHKIIEATKTCAPLAMAYLIETKKDPEITKQSVFEFNVIEVAAALGWESGITKYHLKNLEWITEAGMSKRSFLKVELNTLGFRIKAAGDLSPTELDEILDDLHGLVISQEKAMLYQLEECHNTFSKIGNYSVDNKELSEDFIKEKSNELKAVIRHYFDRDYNVSSDIILQERPVDVDRAISDIRNLIITYKDCTFSGRSIARIFQGISSPNYQAIVWGRCKYWRSHIHEDFYGLMKLATQQLFQMK